MYTARPELGIKRVCAHCAVRFYDLGRAPARCPACGTDQPPPRARTLAIPRGPGTRWSARPAAPAAVAQAEVADDDAVPLLDTAEDDDDDDADDVEEAEPKADDDET